MRLYGCHRGVVSSRHHSCRNNAIIITISITLPGASSNSFLVANPAVYLNLVPSFSVSRLNVALSGRRD